MVASAAIGDSIQVGLQFVLQKIEALVSNELSLYKGLDEELKKLKSFLMHQEFLFPAESPQVSDKTVLLWFKRFEDAVTEAEHFLERIHYEYLQHAIEPHDVGGPKKFPSVVALKVKKIKANLEKILEEGTRHHGKPGTVNWASSGTGITEKWETDSVSDSEEEVIGRNVDERVKTIVMLCNSGDKHVSVIPFAGMGGIGKTTLARSIFNHEEIKIFTKRYWVPLSENIGAKNVLELMLGSPTGTNHQLQSRDAIVKKLQNEIKNERFFLVLDNMWDDFTANWEDLEGYLKGIGANKGNCVLVTTRGQGVAATVATHSPIFLEKLSLGDCWAILKKRACPGEATEEIEAIGKKIAEKCQGIPLAAKVVGGMLRNKEAQEWESILDEGLKDLHGNPENSLMQILRLSFDRLPSPWLRKCFTYCSIFRKDFRIEREQLIQLWMADGLLQEIPQRKKTKEEEGNRFFDMLLQRGLFQDAESDEYGNVMHCKMHDFVHELALQNASKNEISEQVRHLVLCGAQVLPSSKNTRTLFWEGSLSGKTFDYFPFLRVLYLCSLDIKELPEEIGMVFNLRYLDISETQIVQLPSSICELYFLESLIAKKTVSPLYFPDKFKNLRSFRFLDYYTKDDSAKLPLETGQLTCLQKLPFFNVGEEKGRRIEELGSLDKLSGSLEIRKLEVIRDKQEAASANLVKKSKLLKLKLEWRRSNVADNRVNGVLEGLQPHANLKGLEIQNFLGDQLPSWIARLNNLMKLEITGSRRIQTISLGEMPKLRCLKLSHMNELKEWVEDAATMTRRPYPKLEELTVENCLQLLTAPCDFASLKKLEVWYVRHEVVTNICGRVNTLTSLNIRGVEQLICLPSSLASDNENLVSITLTCCSHLTHIVPEIGGLSTCLQELLVEECRELTQLPDDLYTLVSLQKLQVLRCNNLRSFPCPQEIQRLTSLRVFSVCDCEGLTCLPEQIIESAESLQLLWISNCQELTTFEVDFRRIPSLYWFSLSNCKKLRSIPLGLEHLTSLNTLWIGPFSETVEFDSLKPMFDAIEQLSTTLEDLQLFAGPHWDSLPDQLQYLQRLEQLCLHNFGIEEIPEWFENFTLLQNLSLFSCERLQHLPSRQSMSRLTCLRELLTDRCPLLEHKLEHDSGPNSERSKIPNVEVKSWLPLSTP